MEFIRSVRYKNRLTFKMKMQWIYYFPFDFSVYIVCECKILCFRFALVLSFIHLTLLCFCCAYSELVVALLLCIRSSTSLNQFVCLLLLLLLVCESVRRTNVCLICLEINHLRTENVFFAIAYCKWICRLDSIFKLAKWLQRWRTCSSICSFVPLLCATVLNSQSMLVSFGLCLSLLSLKIDCCKNTKD